MKTEGELLSELLESLDDLDERRARNIIRLAVDLANVKSLRLADALTRAARQSPSADVPRADSSVSG